MVDPNERGFSLIEVVICLALLVLAAVTALAALPVLTRASQADLVRDAATQLGGAALERVRAAVAYAPAGTATSDHTYALGASTSYVASAHVHRALCGAAGPTTDVPMPVTLRYDAASDVVTATVTYPTTACAGAPTASVTLSAQLAPSALAPGSTVTQPIGDPAQQ